MERSSVPIDNTTEKAEYHKFPIDIYVKYPAQKGKPKKVVVGTKRSNIGIEMMLRRVIF